MYIPALKGKGIVLEQHDEHQRDMGKGKQRLVVFEVIMNLIVSKRLFIYDDVLVEFEANKSSHAIEITHTSTS